MILTKKDVDKIRDALDARRDDYLTTASGDGIPVPKDSALSEGFEAGYFAALRALNGLLNANRRQHEPPRRHF